MRRDLRRARRVADRVPETDLRPAKRIVLEPGDLVSATARKGSLIRLIPEVGAVKGKLSKLDELFVARGVDHDPDRGLVAVAAVSRVLLVDGEGAVIVLTSPDPEGAGFQFVNDVLFDREGNLLIADMGTVTAGPDPVDGAIWQYDLGAATFRRVGMKRPLSNPKLLARGPKGKIYVVDGEGGPRISPAFDLYYDAVYEVRGKTRDNVKRVFTDAGLQATAFDIASDQRFWFGSLGEIVTLRKGVLSLPCSLPLPFQFVTGLALTSADEAYLMDGVDTKKGKRTLYQVDASCVSVPLLVGKKIAGGRGLTLVDEPAS